MTTALWRIWTWLRRRLDSRHTPRPGWTVDAITADIERAAEQDQDPQTGRHQRRSP